MAQYRKHDTSKFCLVLFLVAIVYLYATTDLKVVVSEDFHYSDLAVQILRKTTSPSVPVETITQNKDGKRQDCSDAPWPRLQLFVTMHESEYNEFLTCPWRSAVLFWPKSELNMTVVLDEESPNTRSLGEKILKDLSPYGNIQVGYNPLLPYYKSGHNRQQLIMFWADNFTDADTEYVGFIDTDTVFYTPVQLEDIFENGKPVIIGLFGKPTDLCWAEVPAGTLMALEKLEALRCMSYFPVVIKIKHIIEMRDYMVKLHGMTFGYVFQKLWTNRFYGQFNIMCNYVWYFHRDEYTWYVQEFEPNWNGTAPYGQVPNLTSAGILASMLFPKPRISSHWGYRFFSKDNLEEVFIKGKQYACTALNTTMEIKANQSTCEYNIEHFTFENYAWTWHKDVCKAYNERQKRQGNCLSPNITSNLCGT